MATYYVRPDGLDTHAGTGPTAANAWKTIGKALGASGIASGDTVYVAPGVYREAVTVAMTSPTATTSIIGDPTASQFSDLTAGEVRWTAWTTSDAAAPSSSPTLALAGRNFLAFSNLVIQAGSSANGAIESSATPGAHDISFTDCTLLLGRQTASQIANITAVGGSALNWTLDRCRIFAGANAINLTLPQTTTADYDVNVLIRNCFFIGGGPAVKVSSSGTSTNFGGGVRLLNCTSLVNSNILSCATTGLSTTIPCTVNGCWIFGAGGVGINATAAGQITEDYNYICAQTSRTNVTAGTHSLDISTTAPLIHLGQELLWGGQLRPFWTPTSTSPQLGLGTPSGAPTVDLLNRPRPAGAAVTAAGALERHDTAVQVSSPVHGTTTHSWQISGPGDHEFQLPVDAAAQTPSVYVQYDGSYGAGTKPQLQLRNGGQIGVADQTITMGAPGANTWAQLTLASFTPTAKGIISIRFVSSAAAGSLVTFGDFQP